MPTRISYDGMSRLTAAGYLENGKLNNHFSTSYKYDLMGNILTLRREGLLDSGDYGTIDDLTYSYEGNQVVKIDDAADESPSYSGAMHFRDAANEETEYTYDANGNMLTDSNKGITSIEYNVLDLPQCINIKPNVLGNSDNKVCYTYSADGTKLSSTYKNGDSQVLPYRPKPSSSIKTNGMVTPMVRLLENNYYYCSNLVYNNDRLSTILFDGGYASVDESGGIVMHFYVKDHLGSNRLVVDGNGNIETVNHYYPFGALMGDRCGVSRNKYKYIGKELDTMYGWNMQDHEARWYDPVLGRWMATDPLQEKYASVSSYGYCINNPIVLIDSDGKDIYPVLYNTTDQRGHAIGIIYKSIKKYMTAMRMFGQTTYGRQFIGAFIEKNQTQYGVRGNGKYSKYIFKIEEYYLPKVEDQFRFMYNIEGAFSAEEIDGKLNIILQLDVMNQSTNELAETITHELALHGSDLDKIIKAYEKGGMNAVKKLFKRDPEGDMDHKSLAKQDKKHEGVSNYNQVKREMIKKYPSTKNIFNKEKKKYEKIFGI